MEGDIGGVNFTPGGGEIIEELGMKGRISTIGRCPGLNH